MKIIKAIKEDLEFDASKNNANVKTPVIKDGVATVPPVYAKAWEQEEKNAKHAEKVFNALKKNTEKKVAGNEEDTGEIILSEAIFLKDYNQDNYLDFDMFDFVSNLFTDTDSAATPRVPKDLQYVTFMKGGLPYKKPQKFKKFEYVARGGFDIAPKFNNDDETPDEYTYENDGAGQFSVTTDGNIVLYANKVEDFEQALRIADYYKLRHTQPVRSRSNMSKWGYSVTVYVPMIAPGYPMMVEDYLEDIDMSIETVMPTAWVSTYRDRQDADTIDVDKPVKEPAYA